jgi:hypothetical protein
MEWGTGGTLAFEIRADGGMTRPEHVSQDSMPCGWDVRFRARAVSVTDKVLAFTDGLL